MYYIYILIDPRDYRVRYVGQTLDISRRYREHGHRIYGDSHRARWVRKLKSLSLLPIMKIVESADITEIDWYETWWIIYGNICGWDLLNQSLGGRGSTRHEVSADTRKIISHKLKGNRNSLGCKRSEETKNKIRKSLTGVKHTEQRRENIRKGKKKKLKGSEVASSILTEEDVLKIDQMLRDGHSGKSIASMYNVRPTTISTIRSGHNWGWLTKRTNDDKGWRRGEQQHNSKLNEEEAKCIRFLLGMGVTQKNIAKLYHVSQGTISDINNKRTWVHL